MGGKRAGKGKQIYLYIAILILLSSLSCTLSKSVDTIMGVKIRDSKGDETREHLALGRKYFYQGNYVKALQEHEKVISMAGGISPGDESVFYIGVIYAHPANPAKDYGMSLQYCRKLLKDYPKSPLVEQAKAIINLLQEYDKLNKTVERLNTTVERLNTIIEESKKVDIGIDERKRKKAK